MSIENLDVGKDILPLKKTENKDSVKRIDPGFNEFFSLPLTSIKELWGFRNCPAGIAITRTRIWVCHLPFMESADTDRLWPSWDVLENEQPLRAIVFGANHQRVESLSQAIKDKTKIRSVSEQVISARGNSGVFDLHVIPMYSSLLFSFSEKDNQDNLISELQLL